MKTKPKDDTTYTLNSKFKPNSNWKKASEE